MYKTTIVESVMASLPSKVVVIVQSLTNSKVLIEVSFKGVDKSFLKIKKIWKDYSSERGTWGSLNSYSFKSSSIKSGRVWITCFFNFSSDSVISLTQLFQKSVYNRNKLFKNIVIIKICRYAHIESYIQVSTTILLIY